MKKVLLAFFIAILFCNAEAQTPIITTYAGGGSSTPANGIVSTTAYFNGNLFGLTNDAAGNIYASLGNQIYKFSTTGTMTMLLTAEKAAQASLSDIRGLAVDAANSVYLCDFTANAVYKINTGGVLSRVAGDGVPTRSGDGGPAINAQISRPIGLAIDGPGNIYIAEYGSGVVRKITKDGNINTIAGGGSSGEEGIPATSASIAPYSIAADAAGNVYIFTGGRIRKMDTNGTINSIAGNGQNDFYGDGGPALQASLGYLIYGLAIDGSGSIYVSDGYNHRIRKVINGTINTIVGNYYTYDTGDDGPAQQAGLAFPFGITVNKQGELFIASGTRLRKVYTPPTPTIASFTPIKAAVNATLTIKGTSFIGTSSVTIGGKNAASYTVSSDHKTITAKVPEASALTGEISVTSYGGVAKKTGFTFIPPPTITTVSPASAAKGTTITIKGTNFSADSKVTFGGVPAASVKVVSATTITAVLGDGASGAVVVSNAGGSFGSSGFVYTGPAISYFSPEKAAANGTVTIIGSNFTGATAVTFGGIAAKSFKVLSSSQITAVVGTGNSGAIKITTPKGSCTSADLFEFIPPPTIKSFTPNAGATGVTVTIAGTNFNDVQSVKFGNTDAASFTVLSPTAISAEVASGASGSVSVTTTGGTATLAGFTYAKPLDLSMNNVAFCPGATTRYPASVDVTVTAKNFKDLASLQGSIGWNNSALQYSSIVSYGPPAMGLTAANFYKTGQNRITFVWHDASAKGVTLPDNTILFKIRFSVAALAENASTTDMQFVQDPLPFEASHKVLNLVPVATHDGQVTLPAGAIIHTNATTVCAGETVSLTVNAPGKYQWYKNDVAVTSAKSATYTANSSGTYKVIITTTGGCLVASEPIKVVVNPLPPSPTITSNTPLLLGDTIKAAASTVANASNYIWTTPNGATYYGQKLVIPYAASYMSGTYTVVAVVNGCNSKPATAKITVNNTLAISGRVITPLGKAVPYVNVTLAGTTTVTKRTGVQGDFKFPLATGGNFTLTPAKDNEKQKTNGITAIDITFIQAHLLQKTPFDSPYKLIAADANNSGSVSALDLVHIRRVILGIDTTFPGKRMWAFVNSDYPPYYYSPFPYTANRTYASLNSSATNQDFIGVKIGDVSYDWNPKILVAPNEPELIELSSNHVGLNSTATKLEFYHDDVNAYNKTDIVIPVKVKNFKQLIAMQYTLSFNKSKLEYKGIAKNSLGIEFTDFHAARGIVTAIWNDPGNNAKTLSDGSILFELLLRRKPGAVLDNETIKVTSDVTLSVAYDKNYAERAIIKGTGMITDKKPVVIDKNQASSFTVSPNPSNGDIKVHLYAKEAKAITITVVNVLGKTVLTLKQNVKAGNNDIALDLRKFRSQQSPNYFIQITGLEKALVKQVMLNGDSGSN